MTLGRAFAALSLTLAISGPSFAAQSDALLQAVTFALTGKDNGKVQAIDRENCVFGVGKEIFRLNNVQVNRLVIQDQRSFPSVVIELHGDDPVYENDLGSIFADADYGVPTESSGRIAASDYTLTVTTNDKQKLRRAWRSIYAQGCAGQKSAPQ